MLGKLEEIKKKYEEIEQQMNDPEVVADMKRFIRLNKDYKDLQPIMEAYNQYSNILGNLESARELLQTEKDEEMRTMAKEEISLLGEQKEALEEEIGELKAKLEG